MREESKYNPPIQFINRLSAHYTIISYISRGQMGNKRVPQDTDLKNPVCTAWVVRQDKTKTISNMPKKGRQNSQNRPRLGENAGWWEKVLSKIPNSAECAIGSSRCTLWYLSVKRATCLRKSAGEDSFSSSATFQAERSSAVTFP